MSRADDFSGYKWIRVPKYKMDESLSWEERYKQLEQHHIQETTFLIDQVRELAADIDDPPIPILDLVTPEERQYMEERIKDYEDSRPVWTPPTEVLSCTKIEGVLTLGKTYDVVEWIAHMRGNDPVIVCDDFHQRLVSKCFFHD